MSSTRHIRIISRESQHLGLEENQLVDILGEVFRQEVELQWNFFPDVLLCDLGGVCNKFKVEFHPTKYKLMCK